MVVFCVLRRGGRTEYKPPWSVHSSHDVEGRHHSLMKVHGMSAVSWRLTEHWAGLDRREMATWSSQWLVVQMDVSSGMDAEVSYAFHSERKKHPEKFKNQFTNQTTYAKIGFGTLAHPSPGIAQLAEVKISKGQDKWDVLHIDPSIRSIVCLNLPSFSGGFNPWGTPSRWRSDNWTPPFVDDGFIEVVGFKDAWHGLVLLAPRGHGIRLAQARGIQFKFHKGAAAHTYMRIDGEPWKQPLPVDDDTVVVKISHHGQVSMLASGNCRSKGMQESSSPSSHQSGSGDNSDEDEESREEERRKFGAADTFKIDQDIDIAHLS